MKRMILLALAVAISGNVLAETKTKPHVNVLQQPARNCEYKSNGDYNCKNVIATKKATTVYSSSKRITTKIPVTKPIHVVKKEVVIVKPHPKPAPAPVVQLKPIVPVVPVVITPPVEIKKEVVAPVVIAPIVVIPPPVKEPEQYVFSAYKLGYFIDKEEFKYNHKVKFNDKTLSEDTKINSANNISSDLSVNNYIDYENSKSMIKLITDDSNKILNITKIQIFDSADSCLDESDKHAEAFGKIKTNFIYNTNCYSRDNESFIMKLEGKAS